MKKELNLRNDIKNIETKMEKLTLQKNILIMTLNSLLKNSAEGKVPSTSTNESSSDQRTSRF
jgi:hypothetical protein